MTRKRRKAPTKRVGAQHLKNRSHGRSFQRVATEILARDPLCAIGGPGCTGLAVLVDHTRSRAAHGTTRRTRSPHAAAVTPGSGTTRSSPPGRGASDTTCKTRLTSCPALTVSVPRRRRLRFPPKFFTPKNSADVADARPTRTTRLSAARTRDLLRRRRAPRAASHPGARGRRALPSSPSVRTQGIRTSRTAGAGRCRCVRGLAYVDQALAPTRRTH